MRRALPALLVALLAAAVGCRKDDSAPAQTPVSLAAPAGPASPAPTAPAAPGTPAPGTPAPRADAVEAQLAPGASLAALVLAEQPRATADGKRLVVYVGATWCEPCRRFHDALHAGALDAPLANIRFLELDADRHARSILEAGCQSDYIPMFALPDKDGRCPKDRLEGAVKGERALAYIVPRLRALLDGRPFEGDAPTP